MSEISDLRKELTFCNDKKLVLMISFASDEMIRETMKYPEVFFMDCTARVNKQKREFFFSVIRTPSGKCHLSNMTVIPSGIFSIISHLILNPYNLIFVIFCMDNRKVLGLQVHLQGCFSLFVWIRDNS